MKKKSSSEPATPVAYSYQRFSHTSQADGDSVRRQDDDARAWCDRNKVRLDTGLTLRDKGVSAFTGGHRTNPDRHALAMFLKWVENGRVRPGDYLLIENLDRLSREDIWPALDLVSSLVKAGVRIVQLKPAEQIIDQSSGPIVVMMVIMELSRGHGESKMKSERVGAAWEQKRKRARKDGEVLTLMLPAWVEERDGKLHLLPGPAAAIRRMVGLAAAGYGLTAIIKKLIEEKVTPFGQSGRWVRSYVANLLRDRRVIGKLQPRRRDGTPDGDPIPDYFPAVVTEEEWLAARAATAARRQKPGRTRKYVNVFAGLLKNARDGYSYYMGQRVRERPPGHRQTELVLVNLSAHEGRATSYTFPFLVFEQAVLSMLREVDPREVLGHNGGTEEVIAKSAELARVEAKIAELEAELENGDVAALARVLRPKEEQKRKLSAELAEAKVKAANPLSEAWGECQTLLDALDQTPDPRDARLRLRSILRRVIDSVWLLVVPRGRDRLAAVQIWFADGERCRDYLILHQPPRLNRALKERESRKKDSDRLKARWSVKSLAEVASPGKLDLRRRADARKLEAALEGAEVE